jgi:hypothetical protein
MGLTAPEAERLLSAEEVEIVPVAEAAILEAKEIHAALLEAGVPAIIGKDEHCTKGCSPKLLVLARSEDVERVRGILKDRWTRLLDGDVAVPAIGVEHAEGDGEPPCPACGATAGLVEGACADCGLALG